jgi:hypothetical protein
LSRADVHGNTPYELGSFDVAVLGGGVAGLTCAAKLAELGRKVAVVEPRGALAWEITRARQTAPLLDSLSARSPLVRALSTTLEHSGALTNGQIEPTLGQMVADAFLGERGVKLLFQARALDLDWDDAGTLSVRVALKGQVGVLSAVSCVDCSETATLMRALGATPRPVEPSPIFWTLTFAAPAPQAPREAEVHLNGLAVPVRIRPTTWPNECAVEIALPVERLYGQPAELALGCDIERLVAALGAVAPELANGALAHIADEPWALPSVALAGECESVLCGLREPAGALLGSVRGEWLPLYASSLPASGPAKRVIGVGAWLSALQDLTRSAPLWEQPALAISNLFLLGEAAAQVLAETK